MDQQYIFLFILDAVRKDHLSLYGYPRKTSPNIDKLAKQSDVYNWTFAPSSYTLTSVPSILTSKYPIELSNMFIGGEFNEKDFENLINLKKQGYKTAMFTANIVTSHFQTNLNKFFDYFWDELTKKETNRDLFFQKAEVVMKEVKNFVEKNKKEKLFVVIHLMEAHGPYTPWIDSIFKGDKIYKKDRRKIDRLVNDMFSGVGWEMIKKYKIMPKYQALNLIENNGVIEDFNPNVNEYIAKYDMGIYLMDKELGNFFDFLEKHNVFNKSKVIITADHGEIMGEENIFFIHGSMTHPVLTNVPLIIKNPKQNKHTTINDNFSLTWLFKEKESQNLKDVLIFHPQNFSLVDGDLYINIHNAKLSHNGAKFQNLFTTNDFNFEDIIENFSQIQNDIKINFYQKNKKTLSFKRVKKQYDLKKILYLFLEIQRYNFKNLKSKINDYFQSQLQQQSYIKNLEDQINNKQSQIKNLETQIKQLQDHAKNLETQLNAIKSAKFFKFWQGYCAIRKKIIRK
jgi:hypothetical protein